MAGEQKTDTDSFTDLIVCFTVFTLSHSFLFVNFSTEKSQKVCQSCISDINHVKILLNSYIFQIHFLPPPAFSRHFVAFFSLKSIYF